MVYSASIACRTTRGSAATRTPTSRRHALFLALSLLVGLVAFQVKVETWERLAPWLFVGSLVLLVVVLIPHVGKGVNGARRWIGLGPISFQPSELAKLAVLLYAANYMVRKMEVKERFFRAVLPMAAAVAGWARCCWPNPTWAPPGDRRDRHGHLFLGGSTRACSSLSRYLVTSADDRAVRLAARAILA